MIAFTRVLRADYGNRGVSGSTLILGPVGEVGVGARTAEEVRIKLPPVGLVSPVKIGKLTVRAIRGDKGELVVLPGPAKLLRGPMDRFPIIPSRRQAILASQLIADLDRRPHHGNMLECQPLAP